MRLNTKSHKKKKRASEKRLEVNGNSVKPKTRGKLTLV